MDNYWEEILEDVEKGIRQSLKKLDDTYPDVDSLQLIVSELTTILSSLRQVFAVHNFDKDILDKINTIIERLDLHKEKLHQSSASIPAIKDELDLFLNLLKDRFGIGGKNDIP